MNKFKVKILSTGRVFDIETSNMQTAAKFAACELAKELFPAETAKEGWSFGDVQEDVTVESVSSGKIKNFSCGARRHISTNYWGAKEK